MRKASTRDIGLGSPASRTDAPNRPERRGLPLWCAKHDRERMERITESLNGLVREGESK